MYITLQTLNTPHSFRLTLPVNVSGLSKRAVLLNRALAQHKRQSKNLCRVPATCASTNLTYSWSGHTPCVHVNVLIPSHLVMNKLELGRIG